MDKSSAQSRKQKMAMAGSMATDVSASSTSLRLRSNLLHKLGIHDTTQVQIRAPEKGLLHGVPISNEPLKYESEDEESDDESDQREASEPHSWTERLMIFKPSSPESQTAPASCASSASSSTERRLTFNETVSVVPIPMRSDYSHRVKERLWNDVDDIMLNAQRNAVEFASEGWDWRTVTEDEYMYRDAVSGELIHPVHMEEH